MKKSVMMIPILSIAVIVTIFFGRRYSIAQSEDMDENQVTFSESDSGDVESTENMNDDVENTSSEGDATRSLEYYESNSESLSFYEYLDFISLKNGNVTMAYYGDIDTNASWVSEITQTMSNSVSGEFINADHSYPGYDSYELYIEQTSQAVIDEDPDVIIYALPALPDKIRDIGLAETEEYMGYILDSLLTLEDTKIYLLEPYPYPVEFNQLNSRSLDYRSYMNRMAAVSEDYGLTLIPLHATFMSETLDGSLENFFDETDELNATGVQQVTTLLDALFSEEI